VEYHGETVDRGLPCVHREWELEESCFTGELDR